MSYFAHLMTRVQARVGRWGEEIIRGVDIAEAIDIDRLACPLRYDLWVRIEFIRLLRDQWALYRDDLEAFLRLPQARCYYVWFKEVRCRRYTPELCADERRLGAAFLARVHATARLWSSVQQRGYDRT